MKIKINEKKGNPLFTATVSITAGRIIPVNVFSVAWLTPKEMLLSKKLRSEIWLGNWRKTPLLKSHNKKNPTTKKVPQITVLPFEEYYFLEQDTGINDFIHPLLH